MSSAKPSVDPPVPLRATRQLFVDRRGAGMRVTTHAAQGLVVLSLWRGERCTATFQLEPDDAARLIAALGQGLASMAAADPGQASPAEVSR